MKRTILVAALGIVASVAPSYGQGHVFFSNYGATTDAIVKCANGGQPATGLYASLLYSIGGGPLTPLGNATPFNPAIPGYFTGPIVTIPGYGGGPISFVVQVYDGADYASSLTRGQSALFTLDSIATGIQPAGEFGPSFKPFSIFPCIPVIEAGFHYVTNNGAITITAYGGPGGAVAIPATINGLPVTSIGDLAFDGSYANYSLTSVTIPNGVTNIGSFAFNQCRSLANITIPDTVTSIGNGAFYLCSSLTSITIPPGVTSIESQTFYFCSSLTNIMIPNGVTNIGSQAFINCSSLTSVTIPSSVRSIGDAAFNTCTSLISVTIPDGVTRIGSTTFSGCTSLTNVTIPNSVTSIGYAAFSSCPSLTYIVIPDSVTNIANTAFWRCSSLSSVTIGNSVTSIENETFDACYSLSSVTIGDSVKSIGSEAFNACYSLTNVTIPKSVTNIASDSFTACINLNAITVDTLNSFYSSVDGVLFDKNVTALVRYPGGRAGSYTIPSSVTNIGNSAFSSSTGLTSATIPSSVTSIGNDAFYDSSLTSVVISDGITDIRSGTFYSCNNLTNVTIPNSVTNIGNSAFYNCSSITCVTIPDSVTSIDYGAFQFCFGLTNVTIGHNVTNIGGWAFGQCWNLTAVYFRGNVPSADSTIFYSDNNVTVYHLPGTKGWGPTFASRPTALWSLPYPLILNDGLSFDAGTKRFGFIISWLTNLSVIVEASTNLLTDTAWVAIQTNSLPNGWCSFSDSQSSKYPARFYRIRSGPASMESCFTCTTNNGTITITGYPCSEGAVRIPSTISGLPVTAIADNAFLYNSRLTSVTIPDSVKTIGYYAFALCTSLTNVTIGNGVTNIGVYAFEECGLVSVTIPDSVTRIEGRAFDSCFSLKTVYFKGNPPSIGYAALASAIVYYLPGTAGWDATFGGRPTELWRPVMLTGDDSFGVRTNQFGFNIAWASGQVVVVEACTTFANPVWSPLQTNTLTSDSSYFSDPRWTNYGTRFYRLRSP